MEPFIELIPLGGVGEFGMNCTILRCRDDMILIDAGMTFPGSTLGGQLGIDVIVPDIAYLREHTQKFRAIVLTHGHEDHAGAVSFIVNELPVPVYGSRITLGMVRHRLQERGLAGRVELRTIEPRVPFSLGAFEIEPIYVSHSYPDSFSLAVSTPVGRLLWTGDFKFDQSPIDGRVSDIGRLSEYGEKGVLALFSDSTNSETPGLCPSENSVYEPLRAIFRKAKRKVVFSCFSSSIHRMQVFFDLCREFDRKLVVLGRSMTSNVRIAGDLGYLKIPPDLILTAGEAQKLPDEQVAVMASGSQGEPMSALSRLAVNEVKNIKIGEDDTVILSTRIIPGNEKLISNMENHFYRRGARVYDTRHSQVHVSGHAWREDLKLMINLTRPRFFVPIHGDVRQLKHHAWLAEGQGVPSDGIRILEIGDVLRLGESSMEVVDRIPCARRFIDEGYLEEVHELVLRDRRFLSEDGFLVVVLRLDRFSGKVLGEPELISRGFVLMESSEQLVEDTRVEILDTVRETPGEEKRDEELFKEILRKRLKRFLRKQTGKRPMILPVMVEI